MLHFVSSFFNAWITWWHASEPISHFRLWGLSILVWGRIGKLLAQA